MLEVLEHQHHYITLHLLKKIKWQDWLKNTDANNIFYNALKPQNNLNFKSSNYSNVFGYQIQMMFEINMAGVNALGISGNTDYRYFTPNLRIYDYDLDSYTTPHVLLKL